MGGWVDTEADGATQQITGVVAGWEGERWSKQLCRKRNLYPPWPNQDWILR